MERSAAEMIAHAKSFVKFRKNSKVAIAKLKIDGVMAADNKNLFAVDGLIIDAEATTTRTNKNLVKLTIMDVPFSDAEDSTVTLTVTIWPESNQEYSFIQSDLPQYILDWAHEKSVPKPTVLCLGEAKRAIGGKSNAIQLWGNRSQVRFVDFESYIAQFKTTPKPKKSLKNKETSN